MDTVLLPLRAHELEDLLPLLEVQVLLRCHDINAFIKVIMLFAVYRSCNISCDIKAGSVRFGDHSGSEAVRLKIHDLSAL